MECSNCHNEITIGQPYLATRQRIECRTSSGITEAGNSVLVSAVHVPNCGA